MIKRIYKIFIKVGFKGFLSIVTYKLNKFYCNRIYFISSILFGSYDRFYLNKVYSTFNSKLNINYFQNLKEDSFIPEIVLNFYLEHMFDILGSGWIKNIYVKRFINNDNLDRKITSQYQVKKK